jgi:hypothetical protein
MSEVAARKVILLSFLIREDASIQFYTVDI